MRDRVLALLRRAGIDTLPTPVLLVALVTCLAIAVWGFARWGPLERPASVDESAGQVASAASIEPTQPAAPDGGASAESSEAPPPPVMFVAHVVGAVMRPGVYEVAEGSRVGDVVALAGGLTGSAEERAVNLARFVVDGEQIVVPSQDEWASAPAPSTAVGGVTASAADPPSEPAVAAEPINVNTAGAIELETLPGIGPVTAANIIADREQNGPFETVDDLIRVSGIGEARLEAIRDLVVVG